MKNVAIIGAGLTGLTLAHKLKDIAKVTIFEKSRGPGGRMSTRYAGDYEFDHGAQYFTIKTEAFKEFLDPFIADNVVQVWDTKFINLDSGNTVKIDERSCDDVYYVTAPRMNSLGKFLAKELNMNCPVRIDRMERLGNRWKLIDAEQEEYDNFDWVISAIPAEQTTDLMPDVFMHKRAIDQVKMYACFALMIGLKEPIVLPWQAAIVKNSDIGWIANNSSKPGRPESFSLLIHSTNEWADAHIDDPIENVQSHLLREVTKIMGYDVLSGEHIATHRWRYANVDKQAKPLVLIDYGNRLAACGDWCVHGRVEGAFLSAHNLAEQLRGSLG